MSRLFASIVLGLVLTLALAGCTFIGVSQPPVAVATVPASSPVPPTLEPSPAPTATAEPAQPTQTPSPSPTATAQPSPTPTLAAPPSGIAGTLITAGRAESGMIALTFDQGLTDPGQTAQVLDALEQAGATSTFFLTGEWTEHNPELVRRIVADGHELANHTYTHPDLTKLDEAAIAGEMDQSEAIVLEIAGKTSKPYMRPPFGAFDDRLLAVMERLGYAVVYWTLDSTDWRAESTPDSMVRWVLEKAKPGDIVVFHGYSPKTAAALPAILEGLAAKGYRFGTVSQVLAD